MNVTEGSDETGENKIAELRQFYTVDQHGRYRSDRLHRQQKRFLFSSFIAIATTVVHAVRIVKKGVELVRNIKQKVQRGKEIVGKIKDGVQRGKALFGRVKDGIESLKDPTKRKRLLCKMAPTLEHGMEKLGKKAINKVDEEYGTSFNKSRLFKSKFHLLQDKCKEKVEEEEAPATNEEMSETVNQVNDMGPQLTANGEAIAKNYEAVLENRKAIKENFEEIKKNGAAIAENSKKLDVNKKLIEANAAAIAENRAGIAHNTELLERGLAEFKHFENEMKLFEKDVNEKFEKTFEHFKEIEKELRNIVLSIEVAKNEIIESVNLTRKEIIENISKARIAPLISHLNTFFNHFTTQSNTLTAGTFQERISKLEEDMGILYFFENVMLPTPGSLHTLLNDIINQKLAIPINEKDVSAVTMLELLNLGTLVYSAIIFWLIQQYSIMLKYYSDKNDLKAFNRYYLRMFSKFKDFYIVLVNKGGFFDRVTSVFEEVQQLPYIDKGILREKETKRLTVHSIFIVEKLIQSMADTGRSLQLQIPEPLKVRLDFSKSKIKTPVMDWDKGKRVRYAIQFYGRDNQTVPSMVSEWSPSYTVSKHACPLVTRIPLDVYNRIRIIYRQINNDRPKLVAVLNNSLVTDFIDIHRDLYDAAGEPNEVLSLTNTKWLLGAKANPNAFFENERRAIHNAVENENAAVVKALLKSKASANVSDTNGFSPLHLATSANNLPIVQMLIGSGANVNAQTIAASLGVAPLHIAAYKGLLEISKLLLTQKAIDINIASSDGSRALHFASSFNRTAIVSLLLGDDRVEVNPQMKANQFSPLHVATVNNHTAVVKLLLASKKVNVNALAKDLSTPLHLAAIFKNLPITKQLLSAGASAVAKTAKGSLALHYAAVAGEPTVVRLLIEASKRLVMNDPNGEFSTPLYLAYQFNHTEVARLMLDNCANLNLRQKFGQSLLHVAAEKGHMMAVRHLLAAGLSVRQRDDLNNTPLHYAVSGGHYSITRVLLETAGSLRYFDEKEVNERYQGGSNESAIFYTADEKVIKREKEAGHYENSTDNVFEYFHYSPLLLMAVGLPRETDAYDMSELLLESYPNALGIRKLRRELKTAIQQNYYSVAKLLFENLAQLTMNATTDKNRPEKSSLGEACAVEAVDFNLVKLIIDNGAEPNSDASNKDPLMPIHEAARHGNWDVLKYLVEEKGADVNITVLRKCSLAPSKYDHCKSVFDYAVESRHVNIEIVKYLIGKKVPYLGDYNLVIQSFYTNPEVATFLVNNGTNVVIENQENMETALHSAFRQNFCNRETVELLLNKGANINVQRTDTHEIPLTVAIENEACDLDIVRFMISRGSHHSGTVKPGISFIGLAAMHNKLDVVQYLHKNFESSLTDSDIFRGLSGKGGSDLVLYFESQKIDLKKLRKKNGETLLHAALRANKTEVAQLLIHKGLFTPPDCGNIARYGTYLHIAAWQNNIEMTRFFAENGCKKAINEVDSYFNETPLSMAIARHGQLGVVNYLIEKGADLKQFYKDAAYEGYSLLSQAIFRKKYDIAKVLIEKGADMVSASKKSENIILYQKEEKLVTESQPVTPQMLAMLRRNIGLLKLIVSKSNVREYLPFQVAMRMKNYQALAYYLFNENPKTGQTVLHESISMGNLNEVDFILQGGAHASAADKNQTTPLHLAASKSNLQIVQMLLKEKCIDLQAKDSKGRTPLDVAKETKNKEIIEAIEKALPKKLSFERKLSGDPRVNTASFDFNGTLLLLDTLIRSKTKKAFIPPPGTTGVTESDARVYALDLVKKFESLLEQISSQLKVSYQSPDSFKLYQSIEKAMLANDFKNIDQLLKSAADVAFESSAPLSEPLRKLVHASVDKLINSVQAQSTDQLAFEIPTTTKIIIHVSKIHHTTVKSIEAISKNQSLIQ